MPSSVVDGNGIGGDPAVVPVTDTAGNKSRALAVVAVGTDGVVRDPAAPTVQAGENHIGEVSSAADVMAVTLTLDISGPYAAGDVLAEFQQIANIFRVAGGRAVLQSLTVHDEDDQGVALDLVFSSSATASLGAENAAVAISDADARTILGIVPIAAADFIDLGGVRVATKTSIGLLLEAVGATRDLYIGAISRGAGTYTASGIVVRLGLRLN